MTTQDFALDDELNKEQRVVEAEIRMPKLSEIKKPDIDLEPVKNVAEQALITTLGIGVLVARGLRKAVTAAYEAGQKAADDPDSLTHKVVEWMHQPPTQPDADPSPTRRISIPVLPISNYDGLPIAELVTRIETLDATQARTLLAYEQAHDNRETIVAALQARIDQTAE